MTQEVDIEAAYRWALSVWPQTAKVVKRGSGEHEIGNLHNGQFFVFGVGPNWEKALADAKLRAEHPDQPLRYVRND